MNLSGNIKKIIGMKKFVLLLLINLVVLFFSYGQTGTTSDQQRKAITALIDQYSEAREKRDTTLLKNILTTDIDQLVSTGEWRNGVAESVKGMLSSSANSPGTRTLTVDKLRMLNSTSAIVDCRYEITNPDNTARKMWSTFMVISEQGVWKITAIRNMLPASQ